MDVNFMTLVNYSDCNLRASVSTTDTWKILIRLLQEGGFNTLFTKILQQNCVDIYHGTIVIPGCQVYMD